jgi:SAM-dependent methyltransferase
MDSVDISFEEQIAGLEAAIEKLRTGLPLAKKQRERIGALVQDLRGGRRVTDFRFDQVYPGSIRALSQTHWTPVEVAVRAAELLVGRGESQVLDIGSGCGKFCAVAALTNPGRFTGVEHRAHLVEAARSACKELGTENAEFVEGNMVDLDWSRFEAFYFFNPFYENKLKDIRIDETVSMGLGKFERYVDTVRAKLDALRRGTRVVTYHGFGGDMPKSFELQSREQIGSSCLELWTKQ